MSALDAAGFWMALNAFLLIFLSFRVGQLRRKHKVNLGHGENEDMLTAIRTHANYTEYAPAALGGLIVAHGELHPHGLDIFGVLDGDGVIDDLAGTFGIAENVDHVDVARNVRQAGVNGFAQHGVAGARGVHRDHPVALFLQVFEGEETGPFPVAAGADHGDGAGAGEDFADLCVGIVQGGSVEDT